MLIEILSVIPKMIYMMFKVISSIKTINFIPFILITFKAIVVVVFILRLLIWIYHLISVRFLIFYLTPGTVGLTLMLLTLTLFVHSFGFSLLKQLFLLVC